MTKRANLRARHVARDTFTPSSGTSAGPDSQGDHTMTTHTPAATLWAHVADRHAVRPVVTDAEAVEIIAEALAYWNHVPELCKLSTPAGIRRAYRSGSGPRHFFDADTIRFFGSRFHTGAPGILIDHQTEAPEGVRPYSLTAWVYDLTSGGELQPVNVGRAETLLEAQEAAAAVSAAWRNPLVLKALRLRIAGAPGDILELLEVAEALEA